MVKTTIYNRVVIKKLNEKFIRQIGGHKFGEAKETLNQLETEITAYFITRGLPLENLRKITSKFHYYLNHGNIPYYKKKRIFDYMPVLLDELQRDEKEMDEKKQLCSVLDSLMEHFNNLFKYGKQEYIDVICDEIDSLKDINLRGYIDNPEVLKKFTVVRNQAIKCRTLLTKIETPEKNEIIKIRKDVANELTKEFNTLFSLLDNLNFTLGVHPPLK